MNPDLFGQTPDERSIAIIREFEPRDGYWLAFSGGKDSVVLLDLAKRAGVKYEAHYSMTTCDPPELVRFIRDAYPEVARDRPSKSIWQLIPKKGFPTRRRRWCCQKLKERGGKGRIVLTGVRSEESPRRRKRKIVEVCMRDSSKTFVHPVKFWTVAEVWAYIRERSIPYCSLYDEGFERLGCVICPYERNVERSMERWPKIWKAARRSFDKLWMNERKLRQRELWSSAEAMWQFWISRDAPYPGYEEDQTTMFE